MKSSWQNKLMKLFMRGMALLPRGNVEKQREVMEKMALPLPESIISEEFKIDKIPAKWVYTKNNDHKSVILWFHGGAWVLCSINTHQSFLASLCKSSNIKGLIVDYRLAPENPYPAALDDCVEAYRFLLKEGYDPDRIFIGGDSAGGNLAVATLLKLKENGEPMPRAAVLLSGVYDLEMKGESVDKKNRRDPSLNKKWLGGMIKEYTGDKDLTDPLISPIHGDLRGLPPLYICVGTEELLESDSLDLAKRAKEAGVEVELVVGEDMMHDYPVFGNIIPEGRKELKNIASYISQKVARISKL